MALIGSNGAGKIDDAQDDLRASSGRAAGRSLTGDRIWPEMPTHQIVAGGIVQAPEGRQIFGSLTVRENLMLGASGPQRPRRASMPICDRVFELFPILGERIGQRAARSPAASSRCWRSAGR